MLDMIASERLRQPSAWELSQWRSAKKAERPSWEQVFDSARFCYTAEDALKALESEERRKLWLMGVAVAATASTMCPTELVRHEHYLARRLFSWPRADYRTEADGKTTALQDNVALESEGAVAANARSVDAAHKFEQLIGANQPTAPAASANFGGRLVITNASATLFLKSNIAASNWRFHSHSHAIYTAVRTTGGIASLAHSTCNEVATLHGVYYPLRQSTTINTNTATGRIANGSGTFHVNLNGAVGSAPLNTARVYAWTYRLNNDLSIYSAIPASLAVTGSASSSDPSSGSMALLGNAVYGGVGLIGDWADSLFWNREPSAAEHSLCLRYMFLRYGLS